MNLPSPILQCPAPPVGDQLAKKGEGGTFIPGLRWERWRINEIRGWSLKFRGLSEDRGVGILRRRYQAVAKKNSAPSITLSTEDRSRPSIHRANRVWLLNRAASPTADRRAPQPGYGFGAS